MTEETLQEGAGTTPPAATEPAATPNPTTPPAATQSPAAGAPDPLAEAATAANATPATEGTPDPLGEAAKSEPETKPQSQAPEKYENFKIGDKEVTPETMAAFTEVAKKNGLSQEQAQEYVNAIAPALEAQAQSYQKGWLEECAKDAEFGGEHLKENMAVAGAGYRQFAGDDLQAVLKATGLSRHPAVVRHFYRLGKTLQQDKGVVGGASAPAPKLSLYPNSQMVRDLE